MEKIEAELTIRERKWLNRVLSGDNPHDASMEIWNYKSRNNAYLRTKALKKKLDGYLEVLMDVNDLDDRALVQKLKEGLEAVDRKGNIDYSTRHKYLKTAAEWKGIGGEGRNKRGTTNIDKVQILVTRGE